MVEVGTLVESSRCFGMRVEQPASDRETVHQPRTVPTRDDLHLDMVLLPDLLTRLDIVDRSMLYHHVDLG